MHPRACVQFHSLDCLAHIAARWAHYPPFVSFQNNLIKAEKKWLIKRTIHSDFINCTLKDLGCMYNCNWACIPCTHPVCRCMCCPKHGCEKNMSMRYFIKFENVLIVTSVWNATMCSLWNVCVYNRIKKSRSHIPLYLGLSDCVNFDCSPHALAHEHWPP